MIFAWLKRRRRAAIRRRPFPPQWRALIEENVPFAGHGWKPELYALLKEFYRQDPAELADGSPH